MESLMSMLPLLILIVAMYFLMIRPQNKRDKQLKEMRNSLRVGDEIVTIGGICGKIIRTKDETIVIQIGADKTKMEIMRWAVSTVTKESTRTDVEEEAPKKVMPKKLGKKAEAEETTAE